MIQPDERKKRKTDRRDAAALSELLWVNRDRLLQGKPVRGLRQVGIARSTDQENRRLTTLRKEAGQARTRLVNKIRHILRRHNLQWQMPTKKFPSKSGLAWLKQLALPTIDRLEMDHLLADLEQVEKRLQELEQVIARRSAASEEVKVTRPRYERRNHRARRIRRKRDGRPALPLRSHPEENRSP
jgi:transposase